METLRRISLVLLVVGLVRVESSGCPTIFSLTSLTAQPCQYQQIVLELSGNEPGVTYTLLANGSPLGNVAQSVVNGRRRFTVLDGLVNGTYTFSVQATLGNCTVTMGNVSLTVYTPSVPTLSLSSLNQSLCYGSSGTIIVVNTDPQAVYTVRDGGTVVAGPIQGNGGQIQFTLAPTLFPPSGVKTFSVRATSVQNASCYAETANGPLDGATFYVYGLPPAPQISAPEPYACSPGGTARVVVQNAVAGYVYQVLDGNTAVYSVMATTTGVLDITDIPVAPAFPGLGYGVRTVSVVAINPNNNNCRIQSTSTVTITVSVIPTPTLALSSLNQSLCYGDPGVIVVVNTTPQAVYTVRDGGTVVAGPIQGNGGQIQFTLAPTLFPPSGVKTFSVRATSVQNASCYAETANGP
ncbi:MAG: hypothetical protein RML15_07855, partial [Bacteroidota bacterium]|nr:hypothetical protein [Bacteroidota bacterium]